MLDQIMENEKPKDQDPKDLNRQLRAFYLKAHQINPPSLLGLSNKLDTIEDVLELQKRALESINRRAKNEATEKLVERLKDLLKPANTTQAMKDYIEREFVEGLLWGGRPSVDDDLLPEWVDIKGNAGIYDPDKEKIKLVERSVYDAYMKRALLGKRFEDAQSKFMGRPSRAIQDKHLPGWRAEFIARYGEKP